MPAGGSTSDARAHRLDVRFHSVETAVRDGRRVKESRVEWRRSGALIGVCRWHPDTGWSLVDGASIGVPGHYESLWQLRDRILDMVRIHRMRI